MRLIINGDEKELELSENTVESLLASINVTQQSGIAVALNDRVVSRSKWGDTSVSENDRVEIISPFEGG